MGKPSVVKNSYHYLVIGGGIVGAGIFRDLSLHNEEVLLIDKGDFNSQTSQSSSKMLHGGIRYLENFDFLLVMEALREKNFWTKKAPHLTKEEMFILPVYKESKWPLFFIRLGLFLYDLLSLFKNPRFKTLNKYKTLKEIPDLKAHNLRGAGVYSDAVVEDSKLGLECIYDGVNEHCHALNYVEIIELNKIGALYEAILLDRITQVKKSVKCNNIIFAVGPFIDKLMHTLKIKWSPIMIPSKGSHIWIKKNAISINGPMVLQTKDQRIIFVIPQRDAILIGTTENKLTSDEEIFNIKASEAEIDYILSNVNEYFPGLDLTENDIIKTYAGVRPLVKDGKQESSKVSRKHQTYTPDKNMFVIAGGKYTTFRLMARDIVRKALKTNGKSYNSKLTEAPLRYKSQITMVHNEKVTLEDIHKIIEHELPRTVEDIIERRIALIDKPHMLPDRTLIEELLKSKEIRTF